MKFNFKIQQYQTDAVKAVTDVFEGQRKYDKFTYLRDINRKLEKQVSQTSMDGYDDAESLLDRTGYRNADIDLSDEILLENIRNIQGFKNIKQSDRLVKGKNVGRCSLDIEMETGTGKTYVYIKTMFELNKKYGWNKFIVVVPSIAIREGVNKTFEITETHFMEYYGKKARYFIYNSSDLNKLDSYSQSADINVMIINTQAFAAYSKEDGKSKESRIIYTKRDEFGSRRPIDVIAANRPIIICDEPQKMGKDGSATQKALEKFNPLFTLNYSATHAKQNNLVYVLDALEAYNQKLVKKIEVKGFEVKNLRGTEKYLYLSSIILSTNKPPVAKIELEVNSKTAVSRKTRLLNVGDDLYYVSNQMEQYKGFVISEIDPYKNTVSFTNGETIEAGDVVNDVSEDTMRRVQIRETIISHFKKEEMLFNKGIKTLSLFFIDEVAKYRQYDEDGNQVLGSYGQVFEQEYADILSQYMTLEDAPYQRYLRQYCMDPKEVHNGYFSIDKKGRAIDSEIKRGREYSEDTSAYDLILKNKERLLSFDEPTRFIFSHSALREGWDNPNVFQICTLKRSDNETAKHQEVGRGLRLCVNQNGNRMDFQVCGDTVHDINKLTVIASESYEGFVKRLQGDISKNLYDRPRKASKEYFTGKTVVVDGENIKLDATQANIIHRYLIKNDYIDDNDNITDVYRTAAENKTFAPMPEEVSHFSQAVHVLISGIYDEKTLQNMISNAGETTVTNELNENFNKKEFQDLWNRINHKYAYTVSFNSEELVSKAIKAIDEKLYVSQPMYTVTTGIQKNEMSQEEVENRTSFGSVRSSTQRLKAEQISNVKYDLIGKISSETKLTRRTVVSILKGIKEEKFYMFRNNPEEFITKVSRLINEQKGTMVIDHISYNKIDGEYDSSIFTADKSAQSVAKAFKAKKAVQDYIFTDGYAAESTELRFAKGLDSAQEVCVYAKLPKGFHIPTPVGNYTPDWAIAFNEGSVKHIFFIAETKGSLESSQYRKIEETKIDCAKKLFNDISTENVKYGVVTTYQNLLNIVEPL